MKLWSTNQNRHIHGLEALSFQGIKLQHFGPDSNAKLLQYSSAFFAGFGGERLPHRLRLRDALEHVLLCG
jgi:hypothetical protein